MNAKHSEFNILLSLSARVKILALLADASRWHLSRLLSCEVASDAPKTSVLLMALDRHQEPLLNHTISWLFLSTIFSKPANILEHCRTGYGRSLLSMLMPYDKFTRTYEN
jgi:hypothetical protein